MLYEQETELLRRCFYDIHNEVGPGRGEEAYHRASLIWLSEQKVPFVSKGPHPLKLGDDTAHIFYPDLVVWDMLTVEFKARLRGIQDCDKSQVFDYLKCRGDRLGLLANMGADRVQVKRLAYTPPKYQLVESWDAWKGGIDGTARAVGVRVHAALKEIYSLHGTGYGEEATRKLILCALNRQGLKFALHPICTAYYKENPVHESPLDCILIEGELLLLFTALFESNVFNLRRGRSYLKAMNLRWGIAANFGKKRAEFTGIRRN